MTRKKTLNGKAPPDFLAMGKASNRIEKLNLVGFDMDVYATALSKREVVMITESCVLPGKKATDGEGAIDNDKLAAAMIAATITDKKGRRLVPVGRESELEEFGAENYTIMQNVTLRINGMLVDTDTAGN